MHAVAVIFDFVHPAAARWRLVYQARELRLDQPGHSLRALQQGQRLAVATELRKSVSARWRLLASGSRGEFSADQAGASLKIDSAL
jgi:hypothetical protein